MPSSLGTNGISLGPYKLRLHISIRTHRHILHGARQHHCTSILKTAAKKNTQLGVPSVTIFCYVFLNFHIPIRQSAQQRWNMLKYALQNITTEEMPHSAESPPDIAVCYHLGHRGSKSILIATAGHRAEGWMLGRRRRPLWRI